MNALKARLITFVDKLLTVRILAFAGWSFLLCRFNISILGKAFWSWGGILGGYLVPTFCIIACLDLTHHVETNQTNSYRFIKWRFVGWVLLIVATHLVASHWFR